MLDNSHLCTPPDAVIASTLRIGARWKNIFQSDKKYRHEVPSLRVGWLKTYEAAVRSNRGLSFSTLSSGRLAENPGSYSARCAMQRLSVPSLRVGWLKTWRRTRLRRRRRYCFQYPL